VSASFPEYTGFVLARIGEPTVADKCRAAGIRVTIRWTSPGGTPSSWNYTIPAEPKFAFTPIATPGTLVLRRVTSCEAKYASYLGGHGAGKFVVSTTPFTGSAPSPFPTLLAFRPMSSHVDAVF
jgi:hypothetical protein